MHRISRRTFSATATGFAAGLLAASRSSATARQATPVGGVQPLGFVSMRVRTVETAEQRDRVDELVLRDFLPDVEALEGFEGYLLGDLIDETEQSLSILVLDEAGQAAAFDALAREFVASIADEVVTVDTVQWAGDLLIIGASTATPATPAATPMATPVTTGSTPGHVAVRVHTSRPETDPRDLVAPTRDEFLPILSGLPGFEGYLWYPTEGGFVAISLFESEASAQASNDAVREWEAEFLADYTDGNPLVINATIAYANLPILG